MTAFATPKDVRALLTRRAAGERLSPADEATLAQAAWTLHQRLEHARARLPELLSGVALSPEIEELALASTATPD